jgi:CYTH domain-containing protein
VRKFLVKRPPAGLSTFACAEIRQGYFALKQKDVQIRLREKGGRCFITIKAGRGKIRQEIEIPIKRKQFESLWPLVRAASIVKKRYKIPHHGYSIELDVYEGLHRGLKTAEVEFSSPRQSGTFKPPAWFEREVTGVSRYANEQLARKGSKARNGGSTSRGTGTNAQRKSSGNK